MTDININDIHYKKYLKYKSKYLELKQSGSGGLFRSSPPSPHTVKMLKYIKDNISYGKGSQWYYKINFNFKKLITDLKTDLTNIKSKFIKDSLDTFVESANYTRIIFDISEKELSPKVNLETNFIKINLLQNQPGYINKIQIEYIKTFIKEIKEKLDDPLNLTDMEYKTEFKEILTTYLGQFVTQYEQREQLLSR
jgi:hypothetical protein